MTKTEISKSRIKHLPKKVKIPKKSTLNTFKRTDSENGIVKCQDIEAMFENLRLRDV